MEQMNSDGPVNVDRGQTQYLINNGAMGGPVKVTADNPGLVSERSLFGNSFEEIWSTPDDKLDSQYWWPLYDGYSAGMKNWILVSNPGECGSGPESHTIQVKVIIHIPPEYGGDITELHNLAEGETWTPQFPGVKGGPVEVQAWMNGPFDHYDPAYGCDVIASQRVLFNGAFNEMPGIAASSLGSFYLWSWYDDVSPGAKNWILVTNPDSTETVYV